MILRIDEGERVRVFDELKRNGICNIVTQGNNDVTVESRRIVKDEIARSGAAKRMRAYREKRNGYAPVTPEKSEARSQKSESEARIKKEEKKPLRAADDAEWLEGLKSNPAYRHINFVVEFGKMDAWLEVHKGRQKTRKFILNWLNKIERPLTHGSASTCVYRVQKGNFLKPCGEPAEFSRAGQPLCKVHHESRVKQGQERAETGLGATIDCQLRESITNDTFVTER
jgi:hypothetical protein